MPIIDLTVFDPECVIIDAGSFPRSKIPLSIIADSDRIICCDGAANEFVNRGYATWRIVGDGDSLLPELREKYNDIVLRIPDQETNDQTKAVRYAASKGVRRLAIVGATGKREDHTLGNISLLIDYLKEGVEARIFTDHGVFIPVRDAGEFHCPKGTQVSIFNFGAKGICAVGLRYPLRDFDSWWQGTLNETTADRFRIEADGYWLLFINYPQGDA